MEELLNKLIEKGWKPFGEGCHRSPYKRVRIHKNYNKKRTYVIFYSDNHDHWKVLRQIVSKESGLWQFVCENGMVVRKRQGTNWLGGEPEKCFDYKDYEYRIIESALCNEEDLDKFLLENIKIS